MFARIAVVAAALAAASSAFAAAPTVSADASLTDLARETGVSKRHILMVVGVPTSYAEYRYATPRVERELKAALGKDGYERLLDGDIGTATAIHRARVAAAVTGESVKAAQPPRRIDG